jgi:hypothetical protein
MKEPKESKEFLGDKVEDTMSAALGMTIKQATTTWISERVGGGPRYSQD